MWNYRIIRDEEGTLAFHEVYYDGDNIDGWTVDEVSIIGETKEILRECFEDAMSKPILVEKDGKLVEES